MMTRIIAALFLVFLMVLPASAQLDKVFKGLGVGQTSGLSDAKIGSGLKEAREHEEGSEHHLESSELRASR